MAGQKNILLVEDDALIGMTEALQLREYGYTVMHVFNGQSAVDAINDKEHRIDLILMDINLGSGLDGPQAAAIILKEHDLPIIFLSSHTEREIVDRTSEISSYGYVIKNSNISVLNASIEMAFRLNIAYMNLKNKNREIEEKEKVLQFYEKRYRRLFESARDGILILDAKNGMIVDVNPFMIEMLGYSKEELLHKKLWDISAFKNIDYSKELFKELQEKEYVRYNDLPLEARDGKILHVEFVSNVYLVDKDKVIQCNIRDIEERREHEKELVSSIEKKSALLKEIQHRTKNSFAMITSLIGIRSSVSKSSETKTSLEELTLRVQSISDLYSLLYESDSLFEVSLKKYCEIIIASMLNLSQNIEMRKDIDEITVSAKDAASIGMIIVELVTNALKYAFPQKDHGVVTLDIKRQKDVIRLRVKDNGIGLGKEISLEDEKKVGLHLVDLLVKQLDGAISISSAKDHGTAIEINFPSAAKTLHI